MMLVIEDFWTQLASSKACTVDTKQAFSQDLESISKRSREMVT